MGHSFCSKPQYEKETKLNFSGERSELEKTMQEMGGPQINVAGKVLYLGLFDTIEGAAEARRQAELKYWKETDNETAQF